MSAGLLVWLGMVVDWAEVLVQLKQVHYWVLLPSTLVLLIHFLLRAWRWRYLLPERGRGASYKNLFESIMVGNFATFVLPLRAGEFVRPFLLSRTSKYSFATGFVSIVIERFFDLSVVLATFGIIIGYVRGIPDWAHKGAFSLGVLAVAILVVMIVGSIFPEGLKRLAQTMLSIFPQKLQKLVLKFLSDFLEGAAVLRNRGSLLVICLLSVTIWLSNYLLFYIFLFLFDGIADPLLAVSLAVIVALAVAAPSAPGFIGVFQSACVATFILFGLNKETALAYSLISHVHQYVIYVAYGMFVLIKNNLTLGELRAKST